jgi:TMEM70/TMEM186/TMEM223 protein family
MIRLLIDKARLLATPAGIRSISNVIKPSSIVFNKTRSFATQIASQSTSPAAGGLAKDIVVFKYENPRFFKLLNIFTISQLFFWGEFAAKVRSCRNTSDAFFFLP